MKRRWLNKLILMMLMVCLLLVARDTMARRTEVFAQLELLADVRHEIINGFVEEPDESKMIESAVRGMIESLNDPYTAFLTPDENDLFDKHMRGVFSGIGAAVDIDLSQDRLIIVTPLEESPAWQAGVMAGDIVLEIDGEDTKGMKITECVERLTGPSGTEVTIKVRHPTDVEEIVKIIRKRITIQTVKALRRDRNNRWDFMLDSEGQVGYVRLTQFTDNTVDDLRGALKDLKAQNARGLILDVRFNPGGLLTAAVAVSNMFLAEGQTIVSIKGRAVQEKVHKAEQAPVFPSIPMVILANEASASAAEIVTGALSDNNRAKFVGMRTFGKGSVQQYRLLGDNREQIQGGLKLTNAYYYLPSGRNIHRRAGSSDADEGDKDTDDGNEKVWGVDPGEGFYVPMSGEQMEAMIKNRRDSDIIKKRQSSATESPITPDWIDQELSDPQLAAALRTILAKIDTGDWSVVGVDGGELLRKQTKRETLKRRRDYIKERLEEVQQELADLDDNTLNDSEAGNAASVPTDEIPPKTEPAPGPANP